MGKNTILIFLVVCLSGCGFFGGFWRGVTGNAEDQTPVDTSREGLMDEAINVGLKEIAIEGTKDRGAPAGEAAGKVARKGLETGAKSGNPAIAVPCGVVLLILGLFGAKKLRKRKEEDGGAVS